jgi:hypothetical protein
MFDKTIVVGRAVLSVILGSAASLSGQTVSGQTLSGPTPGQQTPIAHSSVGAREFPVIMRQNVTAGRTAVGSKVQAKLAVATLVDGVVVPRDAILSGEVTESVAKSATDPSRLAIRVDSAQWKKGSAPIVLSLGSKVYLTAWYYPVAAVTSQDLSYEPRTPQAARKMGMGWAHTPTGIIRLHGSRFQAVTRAQTQALRRLRRRQLFRNTAP